MTPAVITLGLVVLLSMGCSTRARTLQKANETTEVSTSTTGLPVIRKNDTKDYNMQGDQPKAQHYVRTSDGLGKVRYTMQTLVPGEKYLLSAMPSQQAPNSQTPPRNPNYLVQAPAFKKDYPWCGNPYLCTGGGSICTTVECLQGAFCCRTAGLGLCCYAPSNANSHLPKETAKRQTDRTASSADDRMYTPVNQSTRVTAKPYIQPNPPALQGRPSEGRYDAYEFQTNDNPLQRPSFTYESRPGYNSPQVASSQSVYRDFDISNSTAKPAKPSPVFHPMHGIISEDDESEAVLYQLAGYSTDASTYSTHPYATVQAPYPYRRYPRSHYQSALPYAAVQQISYPSQVFGPVEPFLVNVHAKREAPEPYANLQQVYYPSQVFQPPSSYRSSFHSKREIPDYVYTNDEYDVSYPSQVFMPYAYRTKRHYDPWEVTEDIPELYYPSQNFYPVQSSYRRKRFWDSSVY